MEEKPKNSPVESDVGAPSGPVSDDETRPGCRGCLWGLAGVGGCLLIGGLALLVLIVTGVTTVGGVLGGIGGLFGLQAAPPRADVVSTRTLVSAIQPLGQLVSISSEMSISDVHVGVQQGVGNACGVSASHAVTGGVEAGIDLTGVTEGDIQYDAATNTYIVTVPEPHLTSCRIDTLQQYGRSFSTCATNWDELTQLARYTALTQFRDDTLEGGILARAETEARTVLTNFLGLVTGGNVVIEFRLAAAPTPVSTSDPASSPAPASPHAASCSPAVPPGWRFDPANGGWTK